MTIMMEITPELLNNNNSKLLNRIKIIRSYIKTIRNCQLTGLLRFRLLWLET